MSYDLRLRRLVVNIAAATNTTLIAGGQLGAGIGSIKVYQVLLNGGGANVLTFYSSGQTTAQGVPILFTGNGSSAVLQNTTTPWFECRPGEGLVLNTTTTGAVTGEIYYALA